MTGLGRTLLNLVFPPRCLSCRALGSFFCPICRTSVVAIPDPFCPTCLQPVDAALPVCRCWRPALDFVLAAGEYNGALRAAIHRFKYKGEHAGAADLALLLAPRLAGIWEADHQVVPVPLHPSRQRQRGYNQSILLARALMKNSPAAASEHTLRRVRLTVPQVALNAAARAQNMEGAFAADSALCTGQTILLIDDVCTTGATLRAAAETVQAAGARQVYAAVLAAAVPGRIH